MDGMADIAGFRIGIQIAVIPVIKSNAMIPIIIMPSHCGKTRNHMVGIEIVVHGVVISHITQEISQVAHIGNHARNLLGEVGVTMVVQGIFNRIQIVHGPGNGFDHGGNKIIDVIGVRGHIAGIHIFAVQIVHMNIFRELFEIGKPISFT